MRQGHIPWDKPSALYPDPCLYLAVGVLAHHDVAASTMCPWNSGLSCPIPFWHDGWKFLKQWDDINPPSLWILLQGFCQGEIKVINQGGWEYFKIGNALLCNLMILYPGIQFGGGILHMCSKRWVQCSLHCCCCKNKWQQPVRLTTKERQTDAILCHTANDLTPHIAPR